MTDFDPTPDDELVSAYLDGEATPAERAVVEGDPRLLARVDELRAVTAAVGAPVPPDDSARDRLIAQALTAAGPVAPVVSLDAARRRRQRTFVAIASVAAALAVPAGPPRPARRRLVGRPDRGRGDRRRAGIRGHGRRGRGPRSRGR